MTKSPWAFFSWFKIPTPDNPDVIYLKRLRVIQTPWFAFYIHWIYQPDNDRHMHDHPWNFWSFILRGGYDESHRQHWWAPVELRMWRRFTWHKMDKTSAHSIISLLPGTITLVFTGRRTREWGFWVEEGFVEWTKYDRSGTHGPDPFMS